MISYIIYNVKTTFHFFIDTCFLLVQAEELLKGYQPGILENGGKFVLTLSMVQEAIQLGDKVLVFR